MSTVTSISRERNPDQTKEKILLAAFEEMHRKGFQAASLDAILTKAGVTKGALYHHFPNKKALGYAVVDTYIRDDVYHTWLAPLEAAGDKNPIDVLAQALWAERDRVVEWVSLGCPLANFTQEMSGLDEGFQQRVSDIYAMWTDGIADALLKAQLSGKVRRDISPEQTATFIVASLEGCLLIAKAAQCEKQLSNAGFALMHYLDTLRIPS